MPNSNSTFDEFVDDRERNRIYQQESLAFEATELISDLMEKQNISKSELALRIGKSKAFVTQLLSGSRNMTMHTFADLAFALGHRVRFSPISLALSSAVEATVALETPIVWLGRADLKPTMGFEMYAARVRGLAPHPSSLSLLWAESSKPLNADEFQNLYQA